MSSSKEPIKLRKRKMPTSSPLRSCNLSVISNQISVRNWQTSKLSYFVLLNHTLKSIHIMTGNKMPLKILLSLWLQLFKV